MAHEDSPLAQKSIIQQRLQTLVDILFSSDDKFPCQVAGGKYSREFWIVCTNENRDKRLEKVANALRSFSREFFNTSVSDIPKSHLNISFSDTGIPHLTFMPSESFEKVIEGLDKTIAHAVLDVSTNTEHQKQWLAEYEKGYKGEMVNSWAKNEKRLEEQWNAMVPHQPYTKIPSTNAEPRTSEDRVSSYLSRKIKAALPKNNVRVVCRPSPGKAEVIFTAELYGQNLVARPSDLIDNLRNVLGKSAVVLFGFPAPESSPRHETKVEEAMRNNDFSTRKIEPVAQFTVLGNPSSMDAIISEKEYQFIGQGRTLLR